MLTHTFKGSQLLQFIKKLVDHCLLLQYYSHQNAERPLSGSIASSAVYFPVNNIIHFTEVLNTLQVCLYCLIKDSLYSLFVHLFVVHLWKNTDVFFLLVTVYPNDSNRKGFLPLCAFYFHLLELGNLASNSRA